MKRILSTSALTLLLASGTAFAQEQNSETVATTDGTIFANVPADQSMLLGTDFIGQAVYSSMSAEGGMATEESTVAEPASEEGAAPQTEEGLIAEDPEATVEQDVAMAEPATPQPERLGDISDIIMNQDGQVGYVILGVGGFLGIGERDVAVNFDSLTLQPDPQNEGEVLILVSATREQIENAPEFDQATIDGSQMQTGTTDTVTQEADTRVEQVETEVDDAAADTEAAAENAAETTGNAVDEAASETGQAVDEAASETGQAVDEAASEAGQAVEQTGDAVEDVTDEATTSN